VTDFRGRVQAYGRLDPVVTIYAHRGYSAKEPEMTRAAYLAAIAWAERTGKPLGLECDVHYSADSQLICLHDLSVNRTSTSRGRAYERTLAELQTLDFGSWKVRRPRVDQRTLITLAELLELTAAARARGVDVSLAIETKHPNPRFTEVEDGVAALLEPYGWTSPGAPVRIISFYLPGLDRAAVVMPDLPRTLLIEQDLGEWRDGHLPDGVAAVGPDYLLLRQDPGYIDRVLAGHREVHVWTVNKPRDIVWCLNRGVTGITTDDPAVAAVAVARWERRRAELAG
jgi:glycerophosphoryl diester phosphodiesterase